MPRELVLTLLALLSQAVVVGVVLLAIFLDRRHRLAVLNRKKEQSEVYTLVEEQEHV